MSNAFPKDFTKHEHKFLSEELEAQQNENGLFIYHSSDGESMLNLELTLRHYRDWLIENKIMEEL